MPGQDAAPPTVPARVSRSRRRRSRLLPAALAPVVAVLLIAPACTKDDSPNPTADAPGPTPSTTAAPATEPTTDATTTTTAPPTPEQEVEAAYLASSDAYFKAASTANPDEPGLATTTAGPSLERARALLRDFQARGIAVEYVDDKPPIPTVLKIVLKSEATALVTFCLVDNARQVQVADEKVIDDKVLSQLSEAEMRRTGGTWMLFTQRSLGDWADGRGCDR